jgi:phosphoribosylglycinamide formyltransferase 2
VKTEADIDKAWEYATTKGRGDIIEVIVEEFIAFESEITLLTITQKNGQTLFCPPIGHRQERGDYQESWQPAAINVTQLRDAQEMAKAVTNALTGYGIWGVEFFLARDAVYFSELSPRPHDTGMVTLAGTTNLSEFELHLRAILGLPIPEISLIHAGASAVILADADSANEPHYIGVDEALSMQRVDVRIFGKPSTRKYRRMGVALAYGSVSTSTDELRIRANDAASKIKVIVK